MKQKKGKKGQKASIVEVKRGRGRPRKDSNVNSVNKILKKKVEKKDVNNVQKTFKIKEVNFNIVKPKSVEKGKMQIDTEQMLKDLTELGRINPENGFQKIKVDKIHSNNNVLPKSPLAKLIEKKNLSVLKISAIFFGIIICFVMSIIYLVSSRTYINIELNKVPESAEFNRDFELFNEDDNLEASDVNVINVKLKTSATDIYNVEIKDVESDNSEGKIRIVNNSSEGKMFVRTTRFVSDITGNLYRLKFDTSIPAKSIVEAYVYADDKKKFGETIETRFSIPGLKSDEARKVIYGESMEAFSRGFVKKQVIDENDIMKAGESLDIKLKQKAVEELINKAISFGDYEIILSSFVYEISNKKIDGMVGEETDVIKLSGNIEVSAVFINKEKVLSSVKNEILSQNTNGYVVEIDKNNTTFSVTRNDALTRRLSLNIKTNIRSTYTPEKILNKKDIAGMDVVEFYKYVNDRGFAKSVNVINYPFWNKKISSILENIFINFK